MTISFKSQSAQRPTAMGTLLQNSSYGSTIPVIYGQTQSVLLAIWAANLRQGGGGIKKFKQTKKGITNYEECIDFLLGHNPIRGVLQVINNGSNTPLNFTEQSFSGSGGRQSFTVTDANFYFVIGVTLSASYSYDVDDYGGQGPQTLSGTWEIPLWNELETGPDPTDPMSYRCWPFCYRWQQGMGATVEIDAQSFPAGEVNIYYAQMTAATSNQPPIVSLNLGFEPQLGSGPEYGFAGNDPEGNPYTEQQIVYPQFAGLQSGFLNLGASGTLPQLNPEIAGKWGVYPTGDADFVDMIEDIYKSGLAQAAIAAETSTQPTPAATQMERGLSSYDLPGTIQKKIDASASAALPPMMYDMPNVSGNLLIVVMINSSTPPETSIGPSNLPIPGGAIWNPTYWEIASISPNQLRTPAGALNYVGDVPYTYFTGYPGGIPDGAIIKGVEVYLGYTNQNATASYINGAQLCYRGAGIGTAKTLNLQFHASPEVDTMSEGGSSDLWGAVLTPAIVNDSSFGFGFKMYSTNGRHFVQDAYLTVYYSFAEQVINSSNGEAWTAVYADGLGYQVWHAEAIGGPNTVAINGAGPPWEMAILEIGGTGASVTSSSPLGGSILDAVTAASASPSVLSTVAAGLPGYLLAISLYPGGGASPVADEPLWRAVTPVNFAGQSPTSFQMQERIIHSPGAYAAAGAGGSPASICLLALKAAGPVPYPKPLGDFIDLPSFDLVRAQCRANGLYGSLTMTSQSSASDWIKTLCSAADAAPVFLGAKLFLYPYSEVSAAGNGAFYSAPSAAGPVAELNADNGDFIGTEGCPVLDTADRIDLPNVLQMQCIDREANYAQVTVQTPDPATLGLYGVRKDEPISNNAVQDPTIARTLLGIQVRRNQYGGDKWTFTTTARWSLLSPMDLITLTDEIQGITGIPVRITSFNEQDDGSFQGSAEPFVYGMCAPTLLAATSPSPTPANPQQSAGNANPPVIFEPTPGLYPGASGDQLWVVVSSNDPNYGGAQVFVSTDGGSSYNPAPGGADGNSNIVTGSAVTGELTADWPAANDPDSTNNLEVDLTESNGILQSSSTVVENNFEVPCYVEADGIEVEAGGAGIATGDPLLVEAGGVPVAILGTIEAGGTPIAADSEDGFGYELMTYAVATLTAANKYTLAATGAGNFLRRSILDAPSSSGVGVDHALGRRFAVVGPSAQGILKMALPTQYIGQAIYFKICTFNTFGAALQSQGDVQPYIYVPTGVPGAA